MMRTRGELLSSCISFALIGAVKVIRGLRHGITDQERHEVADAAVSISRNTATRGNSMKNCRKAQ
jgi:hypothetical protein